MDSHDINHSVKDGQTILNRQTETQTPITVLVVGDPHFKVSNVHETNAMVEAIIRIVNTRNPDIVVVLGDVLDRHETIHVSPLTRSVKFLHELMMLVPTFVLIGNHDLKNNRQFLSDEHPFTALKYMFDMSTHHAIKGAIVDSTIMRTINGHKFVFVPYVPPGRFREALDICPGWDQATCIFAHQEFRGCQMGAIISTDGDIWDLTSPYVISGHIHDYQELQPNILYTGTPIQHAFGDRHDKTISCFTFHSPNIRDQIRIDLGLRRKHIIRITCAEISSYVPQENCDLKIVISGTSGEIRAIKAHPNIDIWKKLGHRIVYKDLPINSTEIAFDDAPVVARAPLRFSTVLYNTIVNNPRMGALYDRIFGGIRVETTLFLNVQESSVRQNILERNGESRIDTNQDQKATSEVNLTQNVKPAMNLTQNIKPAMNLMITPSNPLTLKLR